MNWRNWFKRKPKKIYARSFDAGQSNSRFFSAWSGDPKTADQVVYNELQTLRARSRDMALKNSYAKRYVSLSKTHVLGHQGIKLQVRATDRQGNQDAAVNGAIEGAWKRWQKARFSDPTGRWSFNQQMQMVLRSLIVDGEAFVRLSSGGPFGIQLSVVDAELFDVRYNTKTNNQNTFIRFAIEYANTGRPIAYYMRTRQPTSGPDYSYNSGLNLSVMRLSADNVLHIFVPEMIAQRRGLPWLQTVLGDIKMLDGYMEA